jgi:coatomer subunit beta'
MPSFFILDDMSIKLWNWEKNWACQQVFEGRSNYVMQIVINPKDNKTFATASLDSTVKVCFYKLFRQECNY